MNWIEKIEIMSHQNCDDVIILEFAAILGPRV